MFERISRSWELVKASWNVLQSDKELIIFPLVSGIAALVISLLFAIPFITVGISRSVRGSEDMPVTIVGYVILFLFYVVLYSAVFFCNTALVGAALIRLKGGDPTLSDGFQIASQRIGQIIQYAIISATVGVVLRALSERAGLLGRIVIGFIGFAWNVATFLVVPILVTENVSPIDAIKRSTNLLKKTWGEQIVGNFGIGTVFGLLILLDVVLGMVLIGVAASLDSSVLLIIFGLLFFISMMALFLISSTLQGIFQAAVYRYATDGKTGDFFAPELVAGAFKSKIG